MHSGDEPVGLCDTGLRAVVYCLIVFNVRFCCVRFLCSLFNSACAIKDCFVLFAYAPFTTAVGYGFALSAEALLRRHGLTHLMERECSQSAHKCTIAPYSRSTPVLMHPTLSLDILRSRCLRCLVQRSHLLLLLRLLLSLRIHCSRGHGFLHRFLLCFLMYRDT